MVLDFYLKIFFVSRKKMFLAFQLYSLHAENYFKKASKSFPIFHKPQRGPTVPFPIWIMNFNLVFINHNQGNKLDGIPKVTWNVKLYLIAYNDSPVKLKETPINMNVKWFATVDKSCENASAIKLLRRVRLSPVPRRVEHLFLIF